MSDRSRSKPSIAGQTRAIRPMGDSRDLLHVIPLRVPVRSTLPCKILKRAHLDEWADEEESVGQTNLNSAQQGGNTGAIGGQGGKEASDDGGRGDGGLQHANEGIAVDGLNDLRLWVEEYPRCWHLDRRRRVLLLIHAIHQQVPCSQQRGRGSLHERKRGGPQTSGSRSSVRASCFRDGLNRHRTNGNVHHSWF